MCSRTFYSYSVLGMEDLEALTLENATHHFSSNKSGRKNFFFFILISTLCPEKYTESEY
jgi:hypothetical protein